MSRRASIASGSLPLAQEYGGFPVGIIDTTVGNIHVDDASQTGDRYLLVVAPANLEHSSRSFHNLGTVGVPEAKTRWDGLTATQACPSAAYQAWTYCNGLSYPADGGSQWYLPAMDELELVYRFFKPTTEETDSATLGTEPFPSLSALGQNQSSDPQNASYAATPVMQTIYTEFRSTESLENTYYWTSTWDGVNNQAYYHRFSDGAQGELSPGSTLRVRPVRRIYL